MAGHSTEMRVVEGSRFTAHPRSRLGNCFRYTIFDKMDSVHAAYDEVYAYALGRPGFILQHVVDAHAVQSATPSSKAIGVVFGLVGLYLHVEKHLSGLQVQEIHMKLARRKRDWPRIDLAHDPGEITVLDVLATPAGPRRDTAIDNWCQSVWASFIHNRSTIISVLREYEIF
jgi:hypothetical protein